MAPSHHERGHLPTADRPPIRAHVSSPGMDDSVEAVLAQYGLAAISAPELVATGTLNWNYRVETDRGPRFVRKHRETLPRERIEQEHRLVAWAADRGIPVAIAERTLRGASVATMEGANWAVFPWIEGVAPHRGAMSAAEVFAAGEMHGRIHRVLLDFPESIEAAPPREIPVDWSLANLDRIVEAAREQRAEPAIIEGLEFQRRLLATRGKLLSERGLTRSPSHGDYHDQQLLFRGSLVVAVTDWELFGVRPRLWEVLRSMSFSRLMEGPQMEQYVAGYREHMPMPADECRAAMDLWWQGRLHGAWVFQSYFLEGNTRVAEFFPETLRALRALADDETRRELTERFVLAATR